MALRFSKMHGLGNDFAVIDAVNQTVALDAATVRRLADRHTGIGFDQLLLVEAATRDDCDFRYRIFNADGGEVEQCGNGARCFARFVTDHGLTTRERLRVETRAGTLQLELHADGQVSVDMGVPEFEPQRIPLQAQARAATYALETAAGPVELGAVALGNPHAVLRVADIARAAVAELGPLIEAHPAFPARVNVGFMQVVARDRVRLRVFERGVGETLACGSGACAAVAVGRVWGLLDASVTVELSGGELVISWPDEAQPLRMTGPATHVYEGVIEP